MLTYCDRLDPKMQNVVLKLILFSTSISTRVQLSLAAQTPSTSLSSSHLPKLITALVAVHCTALHCNALHCTALHCYTALYCTADKHLRAQKAGLKR